MEGEAFRPPRPPPSASREDAPQRRRRPGLRARFALFFAVLLLAVNLVVLATQRGPIVRTLERGFEVRGRELALNLAARAGPSLVGGDRERLRDLLEGYLEFEDVEGAAVPRRADRLSTFVHLFPDER